MNRFLLALVFMLSILLCLALTAQADTFGSGNNTFEIEFVTIGDPGNQADRSGAPAPGGSVAYTYEMGKFEISEQMIDKANSLGSLGITKDTRGPDKPATDVTWFEAARFVNWLNTDTGFSEAYKFNEIPGIPSRGIPPRFEFALWEPSDAGYDPENPFRNTLANYVLPSADEWYKAAYYDPLNGEYYDFATGSNAPPLAVAGSTDPGTAVYRQNTNAGPADVMLAGGASSYGVVGLNGNVLEWHETPDTFDINSRRNLRGGAWGSGTGSLRSTILAGAPPDLGISNTGYRVLSLAIPEPSSLFLLGIMSFLFLLQRRTCA